MAARWHLHVPACRLLAREKERERERERAHLPGNLGKVRGLDSIQLTVAHVSAEAWTADDAWFRW